MIFLVIMLAALAATGILETRDGSRRAEIKALVKESRRNAAWRQPEPIRRGRYAVWTPLPRVEKAAQLPHRPGGTDAGRPGNLLQMRSPRVAWDVRPMAIKNAHDVAAS